jgi:hypothetical protein
MNPTYINNGLYQIYLINAFIKLFTLKLNNYNISK